MTDRELMQQALDALEGYARNCQCEGGGAPCDAAEALRARLAQPEPEPVVIDPDGTVRLIKHSPQPKIGQDPVAWVDKAGAVIPRSHKLFKPELFVDYTIPLYTALPQREWVGLTDEELHLQAATYATNRKNAYVEGMKSGEVDHMNEEALNGKWLAHYEGYREGYWVATGDD